MKEGDRVSTTPRWTAVYTTLEKPMTGVLVQIRDRPVMPPWDSSRTHTVRLDEPFQGYSYLTFDPNDLELEDE